MRDSKQLNQLPRHLWLASKAALIAIGVQLVFLVAVAMASNFMQ